MLSCFSKDGTVLLRAAQKTPLLSLPLSKSATLLLGSLFIDGTIQHFPSTFKKCRPTILMLELAAYGLLLYLSWNNLS